MAKVKDALGCREVRGKLGGLVYRISGGGQIVSAKPYGRMGVGIEQCRVKAALQQLVRQFQNLPNEVQEAWHEFAKAGRHGGPGTGICPCASSQFIKINFQRRMKGEPSIEEPPKVGQAAKYSPNTEMWQVGKDVYAKAVPAPAPGQIWQYRFWLRQSQFPPRGYNKPYLKGLNWHDDFNQLVLRGPNQPITVQGRWISRWRGIDEFGVHTPWNGSAFPISP